MAIINEENARIAKQLSSFSDYLYEKTTNRRQTACCLLT